MSNTKNVHKIAAGLIAVCTLAGAAFVGVTPASAASGNCMMTANPPVSLVENLSAVDWANRNANVEKCQQAKSKGGHPTIVVGDNHRDGETNDDMGRRYAL